MKFLTSLILLLVCISGRAAVITNWGAQLPNAVPNGSDVILMQQGGVTRYFTPNQLATQIATNTTVLSVIYASDIITSNTLVTMISAAGATNKVADLNGLATNTTFYTALNVAASIVPSLSNSVDVGTFIRPTRTNWVGNLSINNRVNISTNGFYSYDGVDILYGDISKHNWFLGDFAGRTNQSTGQKNLGLGFGSLFQLTSGEFNTAIGSESLLSLTAGSRNTAIGRVSLTSLIVGNDCTALGYGALELNTNFPNVALGGGTLNQNTAGTFNLGAGIEALNANTVGSFNTALGAYDCMLFNRTGSNNVAAGFHTLYSSTNGQEQTVFGNFAFRFQQEGHGNVGLGFNVGASNLHGGSNIVIGYNVQLPTTNSHHRLNIGDTIYGDLLTDSVGIGTDSPDGQLEVVGMTVMTKNGSDSLSPHAYWQNAAGDNVFNWQLSAAGGAALWNFDSSTSWRRSLTVTRDGNVGIGTGTGASSLDVTGQVRQASLIASNSLSLLAKSFTAPSSTAFTTGFGAHLWSDGTNLCVVMENAAGARTTNKLTMSAWP